MRIFQSFKKNWYYGELEVEEVGTGKRYTLTQRKTLTSEDYFCIHRTVAVPHGVYEGEDDYPYIYEISWMGTGTVLYTRIVDEQTAIDFYKNFTKEILRGHIYEDKITGWFQGRNLHETD